MKNKGKRPTRVVKNTIVIVCGKVKTEANYFRNFKSKISRLGKVRVEVVDKGSNTASPNDLVDEAIQIEQSSDNLAGIWVVFDKDAFVLKGALAKASLNGIKVAWSNEAFELWVIFHFDFFTRTLKRKEYSRLLSNHLKRKYVKSDPKLFDYTYSKVHIAIENAK